MYPIAEQASPGFKVIAREPCPFGHKSMGLPITNIVFIIRVVFIINPHHKGLLSRTAIASPKQTKLVKPHAKAKHQIQSKIGRREIPIRRLLQGCGLRSPAGGVQRVELREDVAERPARARVEGPGAPQLHAREGPVRTRRRKVSCDEHQPKRGSRARIRGAGLHGARRRRCGAGRPGPSRVPP